MRMLALAMQHPDLVALLAIVAIAHICLAIDHAIGPKRKVRNPQ